MCYNCSNFGGDFMSLIVLIGGQAVGKMTVGRELEKIIDAKLLYNHQTIDLFANFLGYNSYSFALSDKTRKELFKAFIANKGNNLTDSIIFTVLIGFDEPDNVTFLRDISNIFLSADEKVYFIELVADLEARLSRNVHEDRLAAKPSKRDIEFSTKELLDTMENHRLESHDGELKELFPDVQSMKIDNTSLSPCEVSELIVKEFHLV